MDGTVRLWDARTTREMAGIATPYAVFCVAVHPAASRLAYGDRSGFVSLVDLQGGRPEQGAEESELDVRRSEADDYVVTHKTTQGSAVCRHCSTENAPDAPWCATCGRDSAD